MAGLVRYGIPQRETFITVPRSHAFSPPAAPQDSPGLELSAYGTFTGISPSDTINKVTVVVTQHASSASMAAPTFELWDGTSARIGAIQTGTVSTTPGHTDSFDITGVTYAQLATLRLRIYAHQGTAASGAVQNVDAAGFTVNYTPAPVANAPAGLATGMGAAQPTAGHNAQLAAAAAAAGAVTPAGTAQAQVATAAGAAPQATAQGSWPATATGAAQAPGMARAQLATAAGVAPQTGGHNARLATAPGAARQAHVSLPLPAQGIFYYPWYPGAWTQSSTFPWTHYTPADGYYNSVDEFGTHIAAMVYGKSDFAVFSWWGQGSTEDGRLAGFLTACHGTTLRTCLYYEAEGNTVAGVTGSPNPSSAQITSDLNYIAANYIDDPGYLWIAGKPAIFVYDDSATQVAGDAMVSRWLTANAAANVPFYLVLKVYPSYSGAADNWHQYGPATATDQQGTHSYTISPGYWKFTDSSPLLDRGLQGWQSRVASMRAAAVDLRLVTTFNEWGEGTAVESASASDNGITWTSPSGDGYYLDILAGVSFGVAGPATGSGTAQSPAAAVGVKAGLATAAGSAPASGMATAAVATANGAALAATVPSVPSLVAQTTGSAAATLNTTATVTSSGGVLVALVTRAGGLATGALTGVTDSGGNTWIRLTRGAVSGISNTRVEAWATPGATPVTSVTFNSGTSQTYAWNISEWSGLNAASLLDTASPDGSGAASSATIDTPSITPTLSSDLFIAAIHYPQATGTLNSAGWHALTNFDDAAVGSGRAAYVVPGTSAAESAEWLIGTSQAAGILTVAVKSAGTGATGNAGLATGTGAAQPTAGHNAQLAAAASAAPQTLGNTNALAQAATATGVAQQAEAQGSWLATAAGASQFTSGTSASIDMIADSAVAGIGTAQQTAGHNAQVVSASGTAPQPTGQGSWPATAAGAALQPTVQTSGNVNAPAGLATGAGAARQAEAQGSWAAAGAGAAQPPVPSAGVSAGLATSTGSGLQAAGQNAQLVTGNGTARQPLAAITINAGLATATGTAPPFGIAQAQVATASGVAQQATVSSNISAPAGLATGIGTAQQTEAQGSWLASATGAAQQPAGHNVQLATGTGAAPASGMGMAQAATSTGISQNATILTGRNALAGLAAASGFADQTAGQYAQLAAAITAALQPGVQAAPAVVKATVITGVTGPVHAAVYTASYTSAYVPQDASSSAADPRDGTTEVTGKAPEVTVS